MQAGIAQRGEDWLPIRGKNGGSGNGPQGGLSRQPAFQTQSTCFGQPAGEGLLMPEVCPCAYPRCPPRRWGEAGHTIRSDPWTLGCNIPFLPCLQSGFIIYHQMMRNSSVSRAPTQCYVFPRGPHTSVLIGPHS